MQWHSKLSLLIITGTAADIYCIQLANPKRPLILNNKYGQVSSHGRKEKEKETTESYNKVSIIIWFPVFFINLICY